MRGTSQNASKFFIPVLIFYQVLNTLGLLESLLPKKHSLASLYKERCWFSKRLLVDNYRMYGKKYYMHQRFS